MHKKRFLMSENTKRILMVVLGSICSALILTFSVLTIIAVTEGNLDTAPSFLMWVFIAMGFSGLITYIGDRTRANLVRSIVILVFDLLLSIIVIFARHNYYLFSLTAGLYCVLVIVARILKIIEQKSIRSLVYNIILILLATLLGIGLLIPVDATGIAEVILIECLFITFTALLDVASVAFGQLKFKVLFKIIVNTFALEVLFGMLATMVASALVLMYVEPSEFATFGDALWYCFAVVTTIGFGDMVAETLIGRIISVILGMYGIIAVAVITSIIVNFYNETSGKRDARELKNIQKEENKKDK